MRVKTSVTLSEETIQALDEATGPGLNRSRLIEAAVKDFVARRTRAAREARDLEILDRHADRLNQVMREVLEFQAEV